MEAPKKIYLALNVFGDVIKDRWQFHRLSDDDIEYTRTDSFVEKAVEWLRCHPSSHYDDLEEFSNVFRKAMNNENDND